MRIEGQAIQTDRGELRAARQGDIVRVMAGPTKREIPDQDVQGLKCLRMIRPLLSRLRKVGTERDRAGNRRLFMDQYCALILMSLFSPAIESLRDLQRACALGSTEARVRTPEAQAREKRIPSLALRASVRGRRGVAPTIEPA